MKDTIQLSKLPDGRYRPDSIKVYSITRNGDHLGFISQDVTRAYWQVQNSHYLPLSQHTTIKAAFRKAREVLA